MSASEFRIGNRTAYFRKAICTPEFGSERVLARDIFQFTEMWLRRECPRALPYWRQAEQYFQASQVLPNTSSPLTSYYCFLNATKALLILKDVAFSEIHGVGGDFEASKRALCNEKIALKNSGVLVALSSFLGEGQIEQNYTLKEVLSNLPFVHRAFRFTYVSHPEFFIPIRNAVYRKHPTSDYIWFSANIDGRFADKRSLKTLPDNFEKDDGFEKSCVIRTKKRVKWHAKTNSAKQQEDAKKRLFTYHKKLRKDVLYLSASPDLWYLKRKMAGGKRIERYSLTLMFAAMHRLSELSRYDPGGLLRYLDGKENWLVSEFINLAPYQFINEIASEITSLECASPGIRPRST